MIPLPGGRRLEIPPTGAVVAILNVTPDSFSDGGRFASAGEALEAALCAADAGAAMVDVGGESTRPRGNAYGAGAAEVPEEEEFARVLPVVAALRAARPRLPISVDTRRPAVARKAIEAGADAVNAVLGLDVPDELLSLVASSGAALVLNHCRGTPATTFALSRFGEVLTDVAADLSAARERALAAGVPPERIVLDPGFGFGKSAGECWTLLAGIDRLAPPGVPLMVGASRKAFLGGATAAPPLPPAARLPESLGAVAVARAAAPGRPLLFRVHDAAETLRFLAVLGRASAASAPGRPGGRPADRPAEWPLD